MPATSDPRLRRSSTAAAVGEGVVAVALPLLAAAVTQDPLAVAGVVAAQHLPWVVVAVVWPALAGDRRTVVGGIDTVRALAMGMLGVLVLAGRETILDIQLAAAVIGLGEALTEAAETDAAGPGETTTAGMTGLAVVGLPLGGFLYEVFPATPFLLVVLAFAVAGLLALLLRRPVPARPGTPTGLPAFAPGTPRVAVTAAVATAASSAVLGILVLFALRDLGLGAPAFGLLLTGLAAASALGGLVAPDVGRVLGLKPAVAAGLLLSGAGWVGAQRLADPELPVLSALALGVGAGGAMIVAVLCRALLARAAGGPVAGRQLRAFHVAVWSAIPAGALLGGWVARSRGVDEVLVWAAATAAAAILPLLTVQSRNRLTQVSSP
jgi:hypothetical protein